MVPAVPKRNKKVRVKGVPQALASGWNKHDEAKLENTKAELVAKIKLLSELAQKSGLPGNHPLNPDPAESRDRNCGSLR